jgi:1-acyl-sn-glycerol-3-phosphate acyltransferase
MIRPLLIGSAVALLTLLLLPLQLAAIALRLSLQRHIPMLYHRAVCALIGVRIRQVGIPSAERPLLVISNHASWLDICVISAVAPAVFVAKQEVASWPVFGWLAKWQRSIFIDRQRRSRTTQATGEIAERLIGGDTVVLFAEGTSNDGGRVLPFRSALIGAVHHALAQSAHASSVTVQPLSVAYVDLAGLPIARGERCRVAWYGDTDLLPHLRDVLARGAIDVVVSWGEPVACDVSADRKAIARDAEWAVRRMTSAALRAARPWRESARAAAARS